MARFSILAFFFAALAAAQVHAQTEPVVVKRPTELREASSERSTSLATLAAQMPVNRLPSRQGAWTPVRTASGVTSTSSAPSNTATGSLRGLRNLDGLAGQTSSITIAQRMARAGNR